jgi:DNA mismatch repair protein MutS
MVNRSMEVLDRRGEIIFLRKIREGPSAESYGLHVARLAGLPEGVLLRAGHIMERLKEGEKALYDVLPGMNPRSAGAAGEGLPVSSVPSPPSAFPDDRFERFLEDLESLDLNRMTPLEALNRIHAWRQLFGAKTVPRSSKSRSSPPPTLFDSL